MNHFPTGAKPERGLSVSRSGSSVTLVPVAEVVFPGGGVEDVATASGVASISALLFADDSRRWRIWKKEMTDRVQMISAATLNTTRTLGPGRGPGMTAGPR